MILLKTILACEGDEQVALLTMPLPSFTRHLLGRHALDFALLH
jgi:hypothetical protein